MHNLSVLMVSSFWIGSFLFVGAAASVLKRTIEVPAELPKTIFSLGSAASDSVSVTTEIPSSAATSAGIPNSSGDPLMRTPAGTAIEMNNNHLTIILASALGAVGIVVVAVFTMVIRDHRIQIRKLKEPAESGFDVEANAKGRPTLNPPVEQEDAMSQISNSSWGTVYFRPEDLGYALPSPARMGNPRRESNSVLPALTKLEPLRLKTLRRNAVVM
ncbi:hypothetical protein BDZ89DRAFT_1159272 [Hymenopellis radicata]|nr:hypothetical protein BDZ89DRAFT_1159272 [Hymenopellis radicata]